MSKSGGGGKAWFWSGVVLVSVSALLWLILIVTIAGEPEDIGDTVLGGVIITVIPIGIGVYAVLRGKKTSCAEMSRSHEVTYQNGREPSAKLRSRASGQSVAQGGLIMIGDSEAREKVPTGRIPSSNDIKAQIAVGVPWWVVSAGWLSC